MSPLQGSNMFVHHYQGFTPLAKFFRAFSAFDIHKLSPFLQERGRGRGHCDSKDAAKKCDEGERHRRWSEDCLSEASSAAQFDKDTFLLHRSVQQVLFWFVFSTKRKEQSNMVVATTPNPSFPKEGTTLIPALPPSLTVYPSLDGRPCLMAAGALGASPLGSDNTALVGGT